MCGKLSSILNQFHIEAFFVHIIKAVQYIISEHVSENPINDCKIVFQMNFFITKIAALMPSPFAWTKYFLPRQKIFPRLKNSHLLVKWMENDFLAMDKKGTPDSKLLDRFLRVSYSLIQSKNKDHFSLSDFNNKNFTLVTFFKILIFRNLFAVFSTFRGLNGLKLENCTNKILLALGFLHFLKISYW